jgi:hypothetical protein
VVTFFETTASLPLLVSIALLLFFDLFDELIEVLETFFPKPPVALEPPIHLSERLRAQLVQPLLGERLHVDEPRLFQDAKVLRHLRLVEMKAIADVVHGTWAGAKELDDAKAVRVGQGGERFDHENNMLRKAYACQGIFAIHARDSSPRAAAIMRHAKTLLLFALRID